MLSPHYRKAGVLNRSGSSTLLVTFPVNGKVTRPEGRNTSLSLLPGTKSLAPEREISCCPPRQAPAFESTNKKNTTDSCESIVFGGGRWIRTTEVTDNRFTVCPLWPLGNSPIFTSAEIRYGAGRRTRTPDLLITNQLLYQLSYTSISATMRILTDRQDFVKQKT